MIKKTLYLLLLFLHCSTLSSLEFCEGESDLMKDLMIVDYVNRSLNYRLPVTYNLFLQGGYILMPSARMGNEGEVAVGYSSTPPYENYNLRMQFMDRLEISGNYRVFKGIEDPILTPCGFGDKSDKGVNFKLALLHPQDTNYTLPGIAIGTIDCLGTKSFNANYIVATQVIPRFNFEFSLGYGSKRLYKLFGGLLWMPFRNSSLNCLHEIAITAEYDSTKYKSEEFEHHPKGRSTKSPINFGIKYRFWDHFDCSLGYIRGKKLAWSLSAFYNLGMTKGICPKYNNPLPYTAPVNTQALGPLRPDDALVQDLIYPMRCQGLELLEAWLSENCDGNKVLRLRIGNEMYRCECDVRKHLDPIIAKLIPEDICHVIVAVEGYGFPVHEYHYPMLFVKRYAEQLMGPYELHVLTPFKEASHPCTTNAKHLFKQSPDWWYCDIYPKTHSFFGSAKGKFKYALGLYAEFNGFLWSECYYTLLIGYNAWTNLGDVKDVDKLNPSQLINVRTDIVNYLKPKGFSIEEAFVQRNWNIGRGWYAKLSGGLFELMYGGVASEILYYPVRSPCAFSLEGAYLRKRTYTGVGFTNVIRKLDGYQPTYVQFHGAQYFANLYYNFNKLDLDLQLKAGKFLANDWGLRTLISRYYPSGMRISFWYTCTNGKDRINGHRYYDKGVAITVPIDIFLTRSSKQFWTYGLSAWLRDVGAFAYTGDDLYYLIRRERERHCY